MPELVTPDAGVRLRGLRRVEYERLVDTGVLEGEKLELLGGELVEMSPQGIPHEWVIEDLTRQLAPLMARGYAVRVQLPLTVDDVSVPEPDIAVTDRMPKGVRPSTAHVVIEVAVSSLRYDLVHKAPRYASAGVAVYVVLDLPGQRAIVQRDPGSEGYGRTTTLGPDDGPDVLGVIVDLQPLLED